MKKVWKFFCSVKLTVVLFVLILIPSIIGTIIQQNAPDPASYAEIYGPLWDGIFRFLGFYDIYHDLRFIALLVMLGMNTFACTINRFRPKWNLIGMLMTHVGLLLILAGALVGATVGVKGFMKIGEGETLDEISVRGSMTESEPIPFSIKLLDFILDIHQEPGHRLIVMDVKTGERHSRKVKPGASVPLSEPGWSGILSLLGIEPRGGEEVEVKRILSDAAISTTLSEGPEQTGVRAVEIALRAGGVERRAFAVSGVDRPYIPSGTHMGIYYSRLDSDDSLEEKVSEAVASTSDPSRLEVKISDSELASVHSAEVGSTFKIEGYAVEVMQYVPDFVIGPGGEVTSRSKFPHNPAVSVKITDSTGGETEQWLFAKFPSMHAQQENIPFEITFARAERQDHVVDHVFILSDPAEALPVVAYARGGKLVSRESIEFDKSVPLGDTGFEISVVGTYENANVNTEMMESASGAGRPALELTMKEGGGDSEHLLWADTPYDVPGYRLMYVQDERIRDFYSVLQVIDGGEVVAEKKIEVNDPLRYGGYTFYQSSYDSEAQKWSGLQVRKDPGVPLVYIGFLVQILGMIVIFYINPLIRKGKKTKT